VYVLLADDDDGREEDLQLVCYGRLSLKVGGPVVYMRFDECADEEGRLLHPSRIVKNC
jgi:hypothetical protein